MTGIGTPPSGVPVPATTAAAPQYLEVDDTADFGNFVSTEEEELDLEEVVEPWHKYDVTATRHAFYPICVGEVLNERYLVEHKLNYGGFSTVWMAHNLQDKRDVALKVMFSGNWGESETRMQDEVLQHVQDTSHLVTYLASFLLPGDKCRHSVLVLPLMGSCLSPVILRKMSMATCMSAAKQLLEALEILHKGGIVHGDLNERNCLWGMVPLRNLDRAAKYKALGRPLKQIIPFIDLWKQGELVQPIEVPKNLCTQKFNLGDFGLAMKLGDPKPQHGYPPMQFCSPDQLHRKIQVLAVTCRVT